MNSNVAAELAAWYERYAATFIEKANSENPDPQWLLDFYGVPITLTTPAQHVAITEPQSLFAALGQEQQRLSAAGYAGSTESDRSIRVLHDRAALIEATWTRHNHSGEDIERVQVAYLAAYTDAGWRFVSIVFSPLAA